MSEEINRLLPAPDLSDDDIDSAIKEVNLTRVSVNKWRAQAVIGRALEQLGAIRVATGEWVISNQRRDDVLRICLKRLKQCTDGETAVAMMRMYAKILKDRDEVNGEIVKVIQAGLVRAQSADDTKGNLPKPRQEITLVQTNVNVTSQAEPK